ncbi:MAG TPA: LPS assembly protein LptD [Planctomycetota bacterium]|nr:LPS assembly protein LptD [Planctomycetota bacterium]
MPGLRNILLALAATAALAGPLPAGEPAAPAAPPAPAPSPSPAPAPATAPPAPVIPAVAPDRGAPPGPQNGTDAAKPKPPARTSAREIEFYALRQQLLRKERAAILSGSAWVSSQGVLLEAENIVVWEKERQAYGQGGVRLTEAGGRLLADEIFYDFGAERGRATGVRLEIGEVEVVPGEASGPAEMPTIKAGSGGLAAGKAPSKWYLSAPEVRRAGPGRWQVVKPTVSSCDFAEPHWRFRASSADYYPGRKVQSFNNVVYLGPVPVFYLPYMARDLSHDYPWTTWQVGKSSEWGYYALSKWGLDLPSEKDWPFQPRRLTLDGDWRQDRGWAYGGGVEYDLLPHGRGSVDGYFLREDMITAAEDRERAEDEAERRGLVYDNLRAFGAPKVIGQPKLSYDENLLFVRRRTLDGVSPADLDEDRYRDADRQAIRWTHRQDFLPEKNEIHEETVWNLDLTAELSDCSDRSFRAEYFRNEYRQAPEPLSFAMLRHQGDAGSVWLTVAPRVDAFQTQTERLPELRGDLVPQPLPGGFFASGSADAGYLRRSFDQDAGFEDFESGRGHARPVLSRPVNLGPVGFVPYVGTDQAWYSRSREREHDELIRGAAIYGADASMRLYGTFDAENDLLNIHALRHVIEPRLFFRGVSEPTQNPESLLDFDQVEDLNKTNIAGAGLFQKIQTKRRAADGTEKVVDLAGIDFQARGFVDGDEAERLNEDDKMLPYRAHAFVSPVEGLKLWGSSEIDAHGIGLTRYSEGVSYRHQQLFTASASYTTVRDDPEHGIRGSQHLSGALEAPVGEHWRLQASASYEFDRPNEELGERGFGEGRFALLRDFHCWLMGLDYTISQVSDGGHQHTFGVTFTVTPKPVNLVRGSNQLLFSPPEAGSEPWFLRPEAAAPAGELRVVPPPAPTKK